MKKRCLIIVLVIFVLVGALGVSGVFSASAFTIGFITNLTYSKTVNANGYVGYSSNPDYKLCVFKFDSSGSVLQWYGIKSDDSTTYLGSHGFPEGVFVCGGITTDGCFFVFNRNGSGNNGTRLRIYYKKFGNTAIWYEDWFNLDRPIQNGKLQFVCAGGNAFSKDFYGLMFKDSGNRFGYAYGYCDLLTYEVFVDVSMYTTNITPEPIGCLMAYGGNIFNTYNGKSYGIQDAMGTVSYLNNYSGVRICGGVQKRLNNIIYCYGVNPDTLDYCFYKASTLDGKVTMAESVAVKGFFGGSPLMEPGVYDFDFQVGFTNNNVCFYRPGGQQYWEFKITSGSTSSKPGNFWDSYTINGGVPEVDLQWLQEHFADERSKATAEESFFQGAINEVSVYLPDSSQLVGDIYNDFNYSDDITLGQFGTGIINPNSNSRVPIYIGIVLMFGVGSILGGLFL